MLKEKIQSMYNRVKQHLLTQKQKSLDGFGLCLYVGLNNLKCAIGALIPDDCLKSNMNYFGNVLKNQPIRTELAKVFSLESLEPSKQTLFMQAAYELQEIHDRVTPEDWEQKLAEFANGWTIIDTPMSELLGEQV